MKFKIYQFKKVTSTNDAAINLIKMKKKENGCVCADMQTKGRGTQGKKWVSQKGNLFGTVFFQLKNNYPPFNEFSIINPVIISDAVKHFCKQKKISLKWPNDIFINGKKVCGILQELITLNDKNFLLIGIGINIISNPKIKNKYEATNILLETRKKITIKKTMKLIISFYENFFSNLSTYNYNNFKEKAESMALN